MNSADLLKSAGINPVVVEDDQNGIVRFTHAGQSITICFDWGVIAEIQKDFGGKKYQTVIGNALVERDVSVLAGLISRGSGHAIKREGHMSPVEVAKWGPPLIMVTEAVETAWLLAMFGPTMTRPEDKNEEPGKRILTASERVSSVWLFVQRFVRGSRGKPSGG